MKNYNKTFFKSEVLIVAIPLLILCLAFGFLVHILTHDPLLNSSQHQQRLSPESKELYIQEWLEGSEANFKRGVQARKKASYLTRLGGTEAQEWYMKDLRIFWDYFYANFDCPHHLERVGRLGDGGKWICGMEELIRSKHRCVLYSFGVNAETTFEQEMLHRTKCQVKMYDPSVELDSNGGLLRKIVNAFPHDASFEKLGLGSADNASENTYTLKTLMQRNGHQFIDILKIDIDGEEINVLNNIMADFPHGLPFGQLQLEIHLDVHPKKSGLFAMFKNWWTKLEDAGLRGFHREANLIPVTATTALRMIQHFEYSFINVGTDHWLLHAEIK